MQYEKITSQSSNDYLKLIKISSCRKFHILHEEPLYKTKFLHVEKFHEPGIAPVNDETGAYHINFKGEEIYSQRFNKTHGFYFDRAAVEDRLGCYHMNSQGKRIYKQLYQWVGNYQENACVVRNHNRFYHIDLYGNKLYQEEYEYVGDFKDDIAVVYKNGLATHINHEGELIHNKWYTNLGIFHKGFAVAEDKSGWFHINIEGNAIYQQRYKTLEPFYNLFAVAKTYDDRLVQIDITGNVNLIISAQEPESQIADISAELAGFWKTYLTNIAVELDLLNILPTTIKLISQQLNIIESNLQRLLRAIWEIGLVNYDSNKDLWQLTPKGEFLRNSEFLPQAARMWSRVAAEENWLKIIDLLKQETISSFPSFKETEHSKEIRTKFYQALIGYTILDTKKFRDKINIEGAKDILLFGVHSLALTEALKGAAYIDTVSLDYYNNQEFSEELMKDYRVCLVTPDKLIKKYDLGVFCRFLQNQDDKKILSYLKIAKTNKISRILVIETILADDSPIGGAVDINIMVETGGKLRKLSDWEIILKQVGGLEIFDVLPLTDYLSVIDIRGQLV